MTFLTCESIFLILNIAFHCKLELKSHIEMAQGNFDAELALSNTPTAIVMAPIQSPGNIS